MGTDQPLHPRGLPLNNFATSPDARVVQRRRKQYLAWAYGKTLDRVNVLGDSEEGYGHTGCINALSWARDGELLLSGGDDTTVRIWQMDPAAPGDYPFVCRAVLRTGHRANIFNAQMLPHSSRIATVAGDKEVRVFDIGEAQLAGLDGRDMDLKPDSTRILKCHTDRVKRIVTEDSPDVFLTVGEDGTVRQHDLRIHHSCHGRTACPPPLVKVPFDLTSLAMSPLTPYQFVVAGESAYGLLFDRRAAGRSMQEEWGVVPIVGDDSLTNCVRRFGREKTRKEEQGAFSRDHITGAKMSAYNGHELLLSYSGDGVYLFSTKDDPAESQRLWESAMVASNEKPKKSEGSPARNQSESGGESISFVLQGENMEGELTNVQEDHTETDHGSDDEEEDDDDDEDDEDDDDDEEEEEREREDRYKAVPIVYPRKSYKGACNVETVKDVNFLGPYDEFVVSGSDDGNFFIWDKATGKLHGIYEGDGSVVNVVEGHPHLPLVAVSGIDTTVKLFAPKEGESEFSRLANAESIVETNSGRRRRVIRRVDLMTLLATASSLGMGEEGVPECVHQ